MAALKGRSGEFNARSGHARVIYAAAPFCADPRAPLRASTDAIPSGRSVSAAAGSLTTPAFGVDGARSPQNAASASIWTCRRAGPSSPRSRPSTYARHATM